MQPGMMRSPGRWTRRAWPALLATLALALTALWALRHPEPAEAEMVARGGAIYAEHCAACHGAGLEGQPNWRERRPDGRLPAPPHDASGHTWHHPDQQLFRIVKDGVAGVVPGYESDMPAFGGVLSDEAIRS